MDKVPASKLNPGMGSVKGNVKILMKEGWSEEEAWDYAYKFARRRSKQRFKTINTRTRTDTRVR